MKAIENYLKTLGTPEESMVDLIQMVRNCKEADDQCLFYDCEFVILKSMITIYDRELKLKTLVD